MPNPKGNCNLGENHKMSLEEECHADHTTVDRLDNADLSEAGNLISEDIDTSKTHIEDYELCEECLITVHQDAFNKNLLKNGFGSGDDPHECTLICNRSKRRFTQYTRVCSDDKCPKFTFWDISHSGGSGWAVEKTPVGSDPLPEEVHGGKSCFVTSYDLCSKEQLIDLEENGLSDRVMDEVRPDLEVSEWYAGHHDCGCVYMLQVSLLDDSRSMLEVHGIRRMVREAEGSKWHQVSFRFCGYGPGVRYVLFSHAGQDSQLWNGHYGTKITAGSVVAKIPETYLQRPISSQ